MTIPPDNHIIKRTDKKSAIDQHIQLKWGLALLGKDKAAEYIWWLRSRLEGRRQSQLIVDNPSFSLYDTENTSQRGNE